MNLYHFTHPAHLPSIIASGMLTVTESNIGSPFEVPDGPTGLHAGPPVVWLLDTPTIEPVETPGDLDMTHGLYAEKRLIRFEVDVPAIRWLDWAPAAAMSRDWRRVFIASAGGDEVVEHWYVMPVAIRRRRWVDVVDMRTGEPIEGAVA